MNTALIASDGVEARIGTLTAGREWFKPWRTISGEVLADPQMPQLQVMLEGVCEPGRFLSLIRDSIVFEDDGSGTLVKKMAGYTSFMRSRWRSPKPCARPNCEILLRMFATSQAASRAGHWVTEGSGWSGTPKARKSLTMAFYAGAIIREPAMANPTIVVITDRNDLDDQLFGTFSVARSLAQPPVQAANRADLRAKLAVESGGVVLHHHPEVLSRGEGDTHPRAFPTA